MPDGATGLLRIEVAPADLVLLDLHTPGPQASLEKPFEVDALRDLVRHQFRGAHLSVNAEDPELAWLQRQWGPLSRRAITVLERASITPERLQTMTDWQLRRVRGLGVATFHEIRGVYPAPSASAPRPR